MWAQRVREVAHGSFDCQPPSKDTCGSLQTQLHGHYRHLPGVATALDKSWGKVFNVPRGREECLVSGQVDIEMFDAKIHRPYKSLMLQHRRHVD